MKLREKNLGRVNRGKEYLIFFGIRRRDCQANNTKAGFAADRRKILAILPQKEERKDSFQHKQEIMVQFCGRRKKLRMIYGGKKNAKISFRQEEERKDRSAVHKNFKNYKERTQ